MKRVMRCAASLVVLISLTACSAFTATRPSPAAGYAFKHKDFDLRYAWNVSQTDEGIKIDGVLKNVRYATVENPQLSVNLVNDERKVLARASTFIFPPTIKLDDHRSFSLLLKDAKLSKGDRLEFVTDYVVSEGYNGSTWHGGFTVNAMTGVPVGVGRSPQEDW